MRIKSTHLKKKKLRADFGILFKQIREAAHLTQEEMAEKMGVSQSDISKIESGKVMPGLMTWIVLNKKFKDFHQYWDELIQSIDESTDEAV